MADKELMITQQGMADLDSVFAILYDATSYMIANRHFKWGSNPFDHAYNMSNVAKIIKKNDVRLAYFNKERPVATFTLCPKGRWQTWKDWQRIDEGKTPEAVYLMALAVKPEFQHRGIAKRICGLVEDIARAQSTPFVRLNTSSDLVDFYGNLGFEVVGTKNGKQNRPYSFFMEKSLD